MNVSNKNNHWQSNFITTCKRDINKPKYKNILAIFS